MRKLQLAFLLVALSTNIFPEVKNDGLTSLADDVGTPGRSALGLIMLAAEKLNVKNLEEAAFLFYASQMQYRFDKEVFGDVQPDGNNAPTLYGALRSTLGPTINKDIMAKPKSFAKVVARLETFEPYYAADYRPGWKPIKKTRIEDIPSLKVKIKNVYMEFPRILVGLLNNPEYFAAFNSIRAYNELPYKEKQSAENLKKKNQAEKIKAELEEKAGLNALK